MGLPPRHSDSDDDDDDDDDWGDSPHSNDDAAAPVVAQQMAVKVAIPAAPVATPSVQQEQAQSAAPPSPRAVTFSHSERELFEESMSRKMELYVAEALDDWKMDNPGKDHAASTDWEEEKALVEEEFMISIFLPAEERFEAAQATPKPPAAQATATNSTLPAPRASPQKSPASGLPVPRTAQSTPHTAAASSSSSSSATGSNSRWERCATLLCVCVCVFYDDVCYVGASLPPVSLS